MSRTQGFSNIRVLVADDETLLAQRLTEFLVQKGFDAITVTNGSDVNRYMATWKPNFVLYDLMLPEMNALTFLRNCAQEGLLADGQLKILVLSGHNNPSNIRECMRLGAADYCSKPIPHESLLSRLVLHLQPKREISEFNAQSDADYESAQFFMHLTDLTLREALKGLPVEDALHNQTGLASLSLKAVRVSVIQCDREARKGFVIASSDKRDIGALEIDLNKYPEINYVLNTEKPLAIDNLAADPTLHFVTRLNKSINFNAMLVAPIRSSGQIWGVVSARMPESKKKTSELEIRWIQIVAHVVSLIAARDPQFLAKLLKAPGGASDAA